MKRSLTLSEGAVHLAAARSGYELEPQDGRLIWRRPGLPPLELRAPSDDPRLPRHHLDPLPPRLAAMLLDVEREAVTRMAEALLEDSEVDQDELALAQVMTVIEHVSRHCRTLARELLVNSYDEDLVVEAALVALRPLVDGRLRDMVHASDEQLELMLR
jgi:hypothetical protein